MGHSCARSSFPEGKSRVGEKEGQRRGQSVELEKARAIAEEIKSPIQLGFPLEPAIEVAGERFRLDKVSTVGRAAGSTPGVRFWQKVQKTNGCWFWLGAKNSDGYGMFNLGNGGVSAHRIAYALCVGYIPPGVSVLHSCDNRACVRPDHLFLGTQLDNVTDMLKKGRGNKASGDRNASRLYPGIHHWGPNHTLRLHPERQARGERVAKAKLTAPQVVEIRAEWRQGISQHALAHKFEVTLSCSTSVAST